ncbi:Type II toxin-antitoxin system RelE/ParE family toxin [Hyphomicrobiales bacterium]|nr:Type II toxin-antitoxin system RelE/ParE family toxin [Hyphomicrobiales bacterium]CAH1697197.1 Type II toxin-antitoxin system RelE/ParE family toxin [Hyphomicrobiales bacterium]CAI0342765.1 toxin ParE1/3/4 [Hyphomicrobiales bacterium]
MQVVFTRRAVNQLARLHHYIADRTSETVADNYVGRLVAYCERFDTFPERGMRRDDVLPGLRLVGFERRATIAFMVEAERIVIEGVFYGGQDLTRRLARRKR